MASVRNVWRHHCWLGHESHGYFTMPLLLALLSTRNSPPVNWFSSVYKSLAWKDNWKEAVLPVSHPIQCTTVFTNSEIEYYTYRCMSLCNPFSLLLAVPLQRVSAFTITIRWAAWRTDTCLSTLSGSQGNHLRMFFFHAKIIAALSFQEAFVFPSRHVSPHFNLVNDVPHN